MLRIQPYLRSVGVDLTTPKACEYFRGHRPDKHLFTVELGKGIILIEN